MLRAIVFDFDGVLADTEPLHLQAYQDILPKVGLTLSRTDYYERYLGFDDVGVFRTLARDQGRTLDDDEIASLVEDKTRQFARLTESTDVFYPGAADAVRRFAEEVPLAIASGALRHEIVAILTRAGLGDAFRAIVAAGDTARSKPAPDPYIRALELLNAPVGAVDDEVAVAIEDSHWGIESARRAGLYCVAVTQTYGAEELGDADLIVPDVAHLTLDALRAIGARLP